MGCRDAAVELVYLAVTVAMRIRARAVRRCGILLKEIEKGHRKNQNIRDGAAPNVQTRKDAAIDAGLSERQAKQSIRVANVPEKEFDEQIESAEPPIGGDGSGQHKTPNYSF